MGMKQLSGYRFDAFNRLCSLAAARKGSPLDLVDLRACHGLTLALGEPEPDRGRLAKLAAALGLDPEELDGKSVAK